MASRQAVPGHHQRLEDEYAPNMRRLRPLLAYLLVLPSLRMQAAGQTPNCPTGPQPSQTPTLLFDVASIKPNPGLRDSSRFSSYPDHLLVTHASLESLLQTAFNVRQQQIEGLPAWAKDLHWDIQAKTLDPDSPAIKNITDQQRRDRLAALLVDRFKVKIHWRTEQGAVFLLEVAKGGPLMPLTSADSPAKSRSIGNTHIAMTSYSMTALADQLSQKLNHPVTDHTALTGLYDVNLNWSPDPTDSAAPPQTAPDLPPLDVALKQQLGLRLAPAKGPICVLVVEAATLPEPD